MLMYTLINKNNAEVLSEKTLFKYTAVFFFVFYFAISLWFNYANQPTGDEPSYLIVAHSIVHDRDIDLKNNYENGDYKAFYYRNLSPQATDITRKRQAVSLPPGIFVNRAFTFLSSGGANWGDHIY